jgi:hypothetical protein
MRYFLIVIGLIGLLTQAPSTGISLCFHPNDWSSAAVCGLLALLSGVSLIVGLATCDIVNAMRASAQTRRDP